MVDVAAEYQVGDVHRQHEQQHYEIWHYFFPLRASLSAIATAWDFFFTGSPLLDLRSPDAYSPITLATFFFAAVDFGALHASQWQGLLFRFLSLTAVRVSVVFIISL